MTATVIRTEGRADLHEEIVFRSRDELVVGDLVDLRTTKPSDSPVYGQARVSSYAGTEPQPGRLNRFRATRIQ